MSSNWLISLVIVFVAIQSVLSQLSGSKMVVYWGQNSAGSFTNDPAKQEKSLRTLCQDNSYDIIVVGFVYLFPTDGTGAQTPGMNFANHCEDPIGNNPYLLDCSSNVGPDITYCQSQGKKVFLSFGGGVGVYGFSSDAQATTFATTVWNMFLGGSASTTFPRPFGTAIFDGIDLDIEGGSSTGYVAFINTLRNYFASAKKQYYISAAPQCFYPDRIGPFSGSPLTNAWFDYVWIQFYNNHCGLDEYPQNFNWNLWAAYAATAVNPNMKLFIGAPASSQAAGSGYVSLATLQSIATAISSQSPNIYGGIMIWDASTSDLNNNFGPQMASYVHSKGTGSNPSPPPPTPATTGKKVITTGKPPVTTGKPPVTTGKPTPAATTGRKVASVTTGKKALTTGQKFAATTGVGHSSTSSSSSASHSTSTSGSDDGDCPCVFGSMKCVSDTTYQTCNRDRDLNTFYTQPQSCQKGLTCHQSGQYIYCY